MAVSSVELIVNAAKAINPLRKVEQQSKKLEQAFNKLQRKSKSSFASIGRDAKKAVSAMTDVKNVIAGAAVGFAVFKAGQAGIARAESVRRLEFLAKGYGEVKQAQEAAAKASKKFGISQTEANAAFANIFARLRPVGVSLKDITSIYNGFNTVARLSGATSVEASNAFTQLAQALGSGALRGDEFNSISEQVPGILTAISKETGVAQGSLRKFAAEGKITSDIVLKALKRIETEGADQLKDALGGPAQAIKDFQNATEEVQVALTQDVVPVLAESFSGLAELIINLEGPIRFIGGVAADTLNQINSLITQATNPASVAARRDIEAGLIPTNIIAGLTGGDVRGGAKQLFGEAGLADLEEQAREFSKLRGVGFQETLLQFMQDRLKTMDAPPDTGVSSFDPKTLTRFTKDKTGKTGKTDEEREQERLALIAAASADRVRSLEQQTLLAAALTGEEQKQFERQIQIADILENTRGLSDDQLRAELETTFALHEQQDATIAINKANEDRLKLEEDQKKNAEDLAQKQKEIAQTIQNNVVGAIESAIDGSKSLAESFSGLLKQLAMMIIKQKVIGNFASLGGGGLLGLIPGLADGGPARAGRPHIVGERGPELFVPNSSGTVVPNHAMGGGASVTVNVDASGSSVEGDGDQAAQLGKAIGIAVQQELIKQKRPGGLLTS
ncbi:phage tape measure protein [uncultured Mediterranean phage uvMED]|nr:phage tape measure protein [uncultured Mediterranean phage uvMED]